MSISAFLTRVGKALLWVIPPILILVAAWLVGASLLPQPAVGIIRLNTDIWSFSASLVQAQIEAALADDQIRAVVVHINSPGGEVVATQSIFLELQRLREQMPVVGSIDDMAASGGYYVAVAADPIYAKPSSEVGNVGVWALIPTDLAVNDVILTSGPFKLTGSNRDEFLRDIEGIRLEFVETVFSQRGERMGLSRAELSQGLLYPGRTAVNLGLVDHIGTLSDAIEDAAERAGIANHRVVDLEKRVLTEMYSDSYGTEMWIASADPLTGERSLPYGAYLLYDSRLRGAP